MDTQDKNALLQNIAEVDIVYRKKVNCKMSERPKITCSADAYKIFNAYWDQEHIELFEEFKLLFLNRSNRVLHMLALSRGGICGTVADVRLILAAALKLAAAAIVLCHNHPSGSLVASDNDLDVTRKIVAAAAYHDVKIFDHLIITADSYLSFADEGLI